jgi:hypothetical protein
MALTHCSDLFATKYQIVEVSQISDYWHKNNQCYKHPQAEYFTDGSWQHAPRPVIENIIKP